MSSTQEHVNCNTLQCAERNDHMKALVSTIPSMEHSLLQDISKTYGMYKLIQIEGGHWWQSIY